MNGTAKRIIKYVGVIFVIGIVLFVSNEFFIRDWRIKHSEKRVQKSAELNFKEKRTEFIEFKDFLQNLELNPSSRIEFLKNGKISGNLSSHSMTDKILNNSVPFYFSSEYDETQTDFNLNRNGKARVNHLDTILETHNWNWDFEGDNNDKDFEKFIGYIGISEEDLNSLKIQINALNCEAIWIHKDKSISIRFDGFNLYQYQYIFPCEICEVPDKYEKLDEGIYSGLYDSGLFCGWLIFDK